MNSPVSAGIKTTIIITNLAKDDFVNDYSSSASPVLALVDHIKLSILNLPPPKGLEHQEFGNDYYLNNIKHWSNLASLSRTIIIFKSEEAALNIYNWLCENQNGTRQDIQFTNPQTKIALQDNLLARSKSFDGTIESDTLLASLLHQFKQRYSNSQEAYEEPAPKKFNVYDDLTKMGIDLSTYNDSEQLKELKTGTPEVKENTPECGVKRSRSLTKTLFKPDLKVDTSNQLSVKESIQPQSPTITVDETF